MILIVAREEEMLLSARASMRPPIATARLATPSEPRAIVDLELELLGLPLASRVILEPLTEENIDRVTRPGLDGAEREGQSKTGAWRMLAPARMAIQLALAHRGVLERLALHWTIVTAIGSAFAPRTTHAVLDLLEVPRDDYDIWEPIVRDLPTDIAGLWRAAKREFHWQESIACFVDRCTRVHLSGTFARLIDEHHRRGLTPGR